MKLRTIGLALGALSATIGLMALAGWLVAPPAPTTSVGTTTSSEVATASVDIGGPFELVSHRGEVTTDADFRGRHLRGSRGVLDALDRSHGATHALSTIHSHNYASLRADARSGARRIGLAGYIQIFGRVIPFRSPGARKVGFRFHCPTERQG